jgi:hypothetical protein
MECTRSISLFLYCGTHEEDHESFVLSHPDVDSQNVLVSEDGTLTALLDWDNVHTVPDEKATADILLGSQETGTRRFTATMSPPTSLRTPPRNAKELRIRKAFEGLFNL